MKDKKRDRRKRETLQVEGRECNEKKGRERRVVRINVEQLNKQWKEIT